MEIEEVIKAINTLSEFEENKDDLVEKLSKTDLEISDLEHYLENENFSASEGYKIAKKIKEVRQQRRTTKNVIQLINVFQQNSNKLINSSNRKMLISTLAKEKNKLQNAEYRYKVLNVEDILK